MRLKCLVAQCCIVFTLLVLKVEGQGENKVKDGEEEIDMLKGMTDRLDEVVKNSAKNIKLSAEHQDVLDELGVDLGVDLEDAPNQAAEGKKNKAKPSLDSTPSSWPGHGQPFGNVGELGHQIERVESGIRPLTFINRYVSKGRPVVVEGLLASSPGIKRWDVGYLTNSPPSAMTNISVYDSRAERLTQSTMSMREFIKKDDKDLFMFDEIPSFLMNDLALPQVFKCEPLLKSLHKHFMSYNRRVLVTEPITMSHDRLTCSLIGQSSFVLVPTKSWESSARDEGTISFASVNYTTHPWLREIEYHLALNLKPGDCVYTPRNWYMQTSHIDPLTSTVVFSWTGDLKKVNKQSCGEQDLGSQHQFSSFSSRFSAAKPQRDSMQDALIHYFVFYLGDSLRSSFTSKQFVRKQRRDSKLFAKLVNWNPDIEEISLELFSTLDVNSDGKFSLDDVISLDQEMRESLVSQIQDRLHDFGSIIDEQQKPLKGKQVKESKQPQASDAQATTKKTTPVQQKTAQKTVDDDEVSKMFKEQLQQEMEKMIKDLEKEQMDKNEELKKSANRKKERQEARDQMKQKNKDSAKKSKSKEEPKSNKSREKFTVIEEEEIEILAEDDDEIGKSPTKSTNKKEVGSIKSSNQKKENGKSTNQKENTVKSTNQKIETVRSTNQKKETVASTNQNDSSKKTSNSKVNPSAKKDEL